MSKAYISGNDYNSAPLSDAGSYEITAHAKKKLPFIFHTDIFNNKRRCTYTHWHEDVELLFCIDGEASVLLNSSLIKMEKGSLIVINSGTLHTISTKSNCIYHCLLIAYSFLEQMGMCTDENEFCNLIKDKKAEEFFCRFFTEFDNKIPGYEVALKGEILIFMSYLFRNYLKTDNIEKPCRIMLEAVKYVKKNYHKKIILDDVSRAIGMSKYHFSRKFNKYIGCNFSQYLQQVRCYEAQRLIMETSLTLMEISLLCGFEDISYFSKVYKKTIGVLPSKTSLLKNHLK